MIGYYRYFQDCPAYLWNGYLQDGPAHNKCVEKNYKSSKFYSVQRPRIQSNSSARYVTSSSYK